MDIGQGLRVMLAKRQMSQSKLAKTIGVTRPYMSSLCNNNKVPSFSLLERASEALDCEVWELVKEMS